MIKNIRTCDYLIDSTHFISINVQIQRCCKVMPIMSQQLRLGVLRQGLRPRSLKKEPIPERSHVYEMPSGHALQVPLHALCK